MNPISLETKLILIALAVLGAGGGILYWNLHEQHKGAAVCEQKDLDAANKQLAAEAKQLDAYKIQLDHANEQHTSDQHIIALAAASNPDAVVCHTTTRSRPVPQVPGTPSVQPPSAGTPDSVRGPDFDPSGDLHRLHTAYEQSVEESCRYPLSQWPVQP